MRCKEFEKLIPDYLNRNMNYSTLKRFTEHLECCEKCKEELTIKFLVTEGIQRLEDGSAFDLKAELNGRLNEAGREIAKGGKFLKLGFALQLFALSVVAGILIAIFL